MDDRNDDDRNERRRRRYAEDPEYRAKVLEQGRERAPRYRDEAEAARRKRRRCDPEFRATESLRRFRSRLMRVYGLTIEDYDRMAAQQGHACKICRRKPDDKLHIDHCHATNTVRGLLCRRCNVGLGNFDDDPDRLREGAAYLETARGLPRCLVVKARGPKPTRLAISSLARTGGGNAAGEASPCSIKACPRPPRWRW
jgi:hypothetical protein